MNEEEQSKRPGFWVDWYTVAALGIMLVAAKVIVEVVEIFFP